MEGLYGYMEAFSELLQQGIEGHITDIVLACGSAGSTVGLAIANYLACGSKIRYTIRCIEVSRNVSHIILFL